jgi:hypothetical protein
MDKCIESSEADNVLMRENNLNPDSYRELPKHSIFAYTPIKTEKKPDYQYNEKNKNLSLSSSQ